MREARLGDFFKTVLGHFRSFFHKRLAMLGPALSLAFPDEVVRLRLLVGPYLSQNKVLCLCSKDASLPAAFVLAVPEAVEVAGSSCAAPEPAGCLCAPLCRAPASLPVCRCARASFHGACWGWTSTLERTTPTTLGC